MRGEMMRPALRRLGVGVAAAGLLGLAGPALAVSGDGSGGGGASTTTTCKAGMVWNKAKGVCERASSSLFDDETLFAQARALALAGDYEDALALFGAIRDKERPEILTMIGYAKRKSGEVEEGIAFYQRALAIDPDNVDTREYLGEGYVAIGRVDLAEAELVRIGATCGQGCEQYDDLAAALAGAAE